MGQSSASVPSGRSLLPPFRPLYLVARRSAPTRVSGTVRDRKTPHRSSRPVGSIWPCSPVDGPMLAHLIEEIGCQGIFVDKSMANFYMVLYHLPLETRF